MNIADYGFAIWETFYVTVLSTAFALVLGLPLGVLLVAGDKDGILPLPGCRIRPTPTRHSCPAVRSSASPLPAHWLPTPRCCCATRPPARWTPTPPTPS